MQMRKICVITGSRAEYGLLYPVLEKIKKSKSLSLQLVVTTMHLSSEFGLTYEQIEADGFVIDEKIENLLSVDSKSAIAKSTGLATLFLSDTLTRLNPDIVLLLGDRYETLAAATTAMLLTIPIAHIHGGERTEGAVDEQIRHAISKMSYLHFTSTKPYAERIIQMGESPSRVFVSGAPGIDNIVHFNLLSKQTLEQGLDWCFDSQSALFTYHPETLHEGDIVEDMAKILRVIEKSDLHVLFTYANADDKGRIINKMIETFCKINTTKYIVVKSLGQLRYLSAMKHVDLLVGNTSSAIIEAASFRKPVVNIGDRQKGRIQSNNVLDCTIDSLHDTITKAIAMDCSQVENVYGDGGASEMIVDVLENFTVDNKKYFYDIDIKGSV